MKAFVLLVAAVVVGVSSSISRNVDNGVKGDSNIDMINLGNVDGKSYFVDNITSVTWLEGRDLCRAYGMELATITNDVQFAFLKSKYNSSSFHRGQWIGARDSKTISALSWDATNLNMAPLPADVVWRHIVPIFQICGIYYNPGSEQNIYGASCSDTFDDVGTLCET